MSAILAAIARTRGAVQVRVLEPGGGNPGGGDPGGGDPGEPGGGDPPTGEPRQYPVSTLALHYTPPQGIDAFGNGTVYDTAAISYPTTYRHVSEFGGDLQAALNGIQRGQGLILPPAAMGGVYRGNFTLPDKPGTGYIHVVSEAIYDGVFPRAMGYYGADAYVMGDRALEVDAPLCARIETPNTGAALDIANSASKSYWVFSGIDFGVAAVPDVNLEPGANTNFGLVTIRHTTSGGIPHHLVFERCLFRGQRFFNCRRGVQANGQYIAVLDSTFVEFHEVGADSQAVWGSSGTRYVKLINCHLEGAAENVMWGGSPPVAPNTGQYDPADIEIRRCHLHKPTWWMKDEPDFDGINWVIKNCYEDKNVRRVLMEGCVMSGMVAGQGQGGFGVIWYNNEQNVGSNTDHNATRDCHHRWNQFDRTTQGYNITARFLEEADRTQRCALTHTLFTRRKTTSYLIQILRDVADITIDRVTNVGDTSCLTVVDNLPTKPTRVAFINSISSGGGYPFNRDGYGGGAAHFAAAFVDSTTANTVVYNTERPAFASGVFEVAPSAQAVMPNANLTSSDPLLFASADPSRGCDVERLSEYLGRTTGAVETHRVATGQWGDDE